MKRSANRWWVNQLISRLLSSSCLRLWGPKGPMFRGLWFTAKNCKVAILLPFLSVRCKRIHNHKIGPRFIWWRERSFHRFLLPPYFLLCNVGNETVHRFIYCRYPQLSTVWLFFHAKTVVPFGAVSLVIWFFWTICDHLYSVEWLRRLYPRMGCECLATKYCVHGENFANFFKNEKPPEPWLDLVKVHAIRHQV